MKINLDCLYCIIKKADTLYSQYENNEEKKLEFMKRVFAHVSEANNEDTSPYISSKIMQMLREELNVEDVYYDIKKQYNKLLLTMEEQIINNINNSNDKVLTGLKYAMVGNYIDFGAMDDVDIDKLNDLINKAPDIQIDMEEYNRFIRELNNAKEIVYTTDNSGEIVFDKIFIKVMKDNFPKLKINVIVKGAPILNDATMEDAKDIGLCDIVNVIDNGTAIPGTQLNVINDKSKQLIDNADIIISKGQGNFETLYECGKNIYYIFLCKCDMFVRRFNIEQYQGIFVNEKNVEKAKGGK